MLGVAGPGGVGVGVVAGGGVAAGGVSGGGTAPVAGAALFSVLLPFVAAMEAPASTYAVARTLS